MEDVRNGEDDVKGDTTKSGVDGHESGARDIP